MGAREGAVIGAWTCCIKVVLLSTSVNTTTVSAGGLKSSAEVNYISLITGKAVNPSA